MLTNGADYQDIIINLFTCCHINLKIGANLWISKWNISCKNNSQNIIQIWQFLHKQPLKNACVPPGKFNLHLNKCIPSSVTASSLTSVRYIYAKVGQKIKTSWSWEGSSSGSFEDVLKQFWNSVCIFVAFSILKFLLFI